MNEKIINPQEIKDERLNDVAGGGSFSLQFNKFYCPVCHTQVQQTRTTREILSYCPTCKNYPSYLISTFEE